MTKVTDYISPDASGSLAGLFLARASKKPDATAYRHYNRVSGQWTDISWKQMIRTVTGWRAAFAVEGVSAGDRVAIMLANSPEWVAFEQAALSLGLIVVPLYANDRPENIAYILDNTDARILLCPGVSYRQHLAPVLDGLGSLQRIVTIDSGQTGPTAGRVTDVSAWLPRPPEDATSYTPTTSETATIVYTSGTTGPPKGVMLSHRNILENCYSGLQCMDIYPEDIFLSFLPLSHMLERMGGYYLPMMAGATVAFARSIPDLGEDLLTVKPTVLVAVPRIFERIYGGIMTTLSSRPKPVAALFHSAVETGWQSFQHKQGRAPWSVSLLAQPLLDILVARKVRDKLGGKLRTIITGGAPLSAEISKLFIGLGLPLYQGYGLTETSPVVSVNRVEDNRPEGVGRPLPGVEVKIGEENELLVRGSCVMQGYWRNKEATDRTIDPDGWLHTGDKAVVEDGHVRITGRLKEIIVLSNGEKIAPTDLEMAISMDPLFELALVLGEGRPFLTLLAVLNGPLWQELAEELGVSPGPESLDLPEVRSAVLGRVEKLLARFPGFVFIKDVTLSLKPWTVDDGLLTPTLKLRRSVIEKHMADKIRRMYGK
jgi:long-chain acyl-CoA synthetase